MTAGRAAATPRCSGALLMEEWCPEDQSLRERPWRCLGRGRRFWTAAAVQSQESRTRNAGRRFRQPRSWNPGKVEAGPPCLAVAGADAWGE